MKKRKNRYLFKETGIIGKKKKKNRVMLEKQLRKYLLSIAGHVLTAILATLKIKCPNINATVGDLTSQNFLPWSFLTPVVSTVKKLNTITVLIVNVIYCVTQVAVHHVT